MELWGFDFLVKVVVKGEFFDVERFLIIFCIGSVERFDLMWSFVFGKTWKHGNLKSIRKKEEK
jgi:hypothetical protein